jgi:hypothetical protein
MYPQLCAFFKKKYRRLTLSQEDHLGVVKAHPIFIETHPRTIEAYL